MQGEPGEVNVPATPPIPPGYHWQRLADAMQKASDSARAKATCSLCSKRDHVTQDHPAPLSDGVCNYCWFGGCYNDGPCDKTKTACECLCLTRGRG